MGPKEPLDEASSCLLKEMSRMKPLRVILSADALRAPWAGIGRYSYELALGLSVHEEVQDLRLMDRFSWYRSPDNLVQPNHPKANASLIHTTSIRSRPFLRAISRRVVPVLKTLRCIPYRHYLYHSPNYALPVFPGKCVSTIHDLSVIRHPEFHPKERVDHLLGLFPSILRRADLILTDSHFSRTEILNYFKLSPDRVITVPLGVDARFRPLDSNHVDQILSQYGLVRGHYALTVGTIEPRKNLERMIKAYETLPLQMRKACPLVLVGNEGWNSEAIHQAMAKAHAEGWLQYIRFVSEEDLPALYGGARVFACVSLYEGFGLPVLEALASGTPVIASKVASLPEVGGQAVHYVNPEDIESIASAFKLLVDDEGQTRGLGALGLEQAAGFTWKKTVTETVAAYRTLL